MANELRIGFDDRDLMRGLDQAIRKIQQLEKSADKAGKDMRDAFRGGSGGGQSPPERFGRELDKVKEKVDGNISLLGKFATAAAAAFSIRAISQFLSKSRELFGVQVKAETQLLTALKGRRTIQQSLIKQAGEIQKRSLFGDEEVIKQQAILASLGFTEDKIKDIISTSVDLSAALGIGLDSAVRNTAKTFSGLSGELGELVPDLRNLTQEELKAGKAVDVLNGLFAGQAQAVADADTNMVQIKNAFGDVQESIGRLVSAFQRGLKPIISGLISSFGGLVESATGFLGRIGLINLEQDKLSYSTGQLQRQFNIQIETLKRGNLSQSNRSKLISEINTKYKDYLPNLISETDSLEDLQEAQRAVNEAFKQRIVLLALQEKLSEVVRKQLDAETKALSLQTALTTAQVKQSEALVDNRRKSLNSLSGENLERVYANQLEDEINFKIKQNQKEQESLTKEYDQTIQAAEKLGLTLSDLTETTPTITPPDPEDLEEELKETREKIFDGLLPTNDNGRADLKDRATALSAFFLEFFGEELEKGNKEVARGIDAQLKAGEDAIEQAGIEAGELYSDKFKEGLQDSLLSSREFIVGAITEMFKLQPLEVDALNATFDSITSNFDELWTASIDLAISEQERLIDSINERIDEQQSLLDAELEAQRLGQANSVATERATLLQLQKEREKAEKERERLVKKQTALDARAAEIQQGAAIATGVAQLIAKGASRGIVGLFLVGGAIALLFKIFANAKKQAAAAASTTVKFAKGGLLAGPSHDAGGIPGSSVELEGGEYVVNKKATARALPLLEAINNAGLDNSSLAGLMIPAGLVSGLNQASGKKTASEKLHQDNIIRDAIKEQTGELLKGIYEKPDTQFIGPDEYVEVKHRRNGGKVINKVKLRK